MTRRLVVLIVGGYGTFGGRLVELLESESRLSLIVAGRSLDRAKTYCLGRSHAKATLVPAVFDRDGEVAAELIRLQPDILVDASGPFQAYGAAPYRLVEACIRTRTNYLDLADGSDFVDGIGAFDVEATRAGVWILSGVSSFPVLTAAVVRSISRDMARVDAIHGGIAPSPFAGVGLNVVRAIAGYAGQRVKLKRNGRFVTGCPLTENMRFTISPPGKMPLHDTLFSLVDVPDLRALNDLWPDARTVWMGAGPVPEILHRALIALAWLVRLGVVPSLSPLARLFHLASNRLTWGEHRGGMFVRVRGTSPTGEPVERIWHMVAEGDDGPLIPSMAVEALVRRALDGKTPLPGARASLRELELEDYQALFASRTIYTGVSENQPTDEPLYQRILGPAWQALPVEIRTLHAVSTTTVLRGRASVERGSNSLARMAALAFGFPKAGTDVPVSVQFDVANGIETWTRTFGNTSFRSRQFAGTGRSRALLCERFGWLTFAMALVVERHRLALVLRRWSVLGLPLPMWLCPRSNSYETTEDGRFRFHVEISHPITGMIVRYQGWLAA
ncbi:MAG TPA: DUF4166 domain-containing protein [Reyranella sp.]|nr:DUF4166 domain-containing protein [Reyranella sp.]